MTNLDLEITVVPEENRFFYTGELRARLEGHAESEALVLLMNARHADGLAGISFEAISSPGATVDIRDGASSRRSHQAKVTFGAPIKRGTEVEIDLRCATNVPVGQMATSENAAIACWTCAWTPWTVPSIQGAVDWNAGMAAVPGETVLRLPPDWAGIVDGELIKRERTENAAIETWRTPPGIARSFAAGPYRVTTTDVQGRTIRTYLLPGEKAVTAIQLANLLGQAIAAEVARFGEFPFQGAYSIVEFPRMPAQDFGAASQQTFILAQPPTPFSFEHGSLQLWAHEAAHAWWVNTVGTGGRGAKWCGESLAELGAVIAVETIEGRAAMLDFLNYGRPGMDPYYSAAGYFSLMRGGQDLPIATMGNGGFTHALANSKGVWIYHMLRVVLGDEPFFDVLRGLIRDFAHRDLSADDIRERFIAAAPEYQLERFFSQWLDLSGAPVFDVDWHATVDGRGILLKLSQIQSGKPFAFDLDVAIDLDDGRLIVETVDVQEAVEVFELDTGGRPVGVRLDPDYKVLMWRPEYGPRPGAEIIRDNEVVPESVRNAVIGLYRFRGMDKEIRVYEQDGSIYVQPEGWGASRLLYQGNGVFLLDAPGEPMITEFDLSASPSPTLKSIEGNAGVYIADRVPS